MTIDVIFQGLTPRGTLEYHTESYQYPAKDIERFDIWLENSDKRDIISHNHWEDILDWTIK